MTIPRRDRNVRTTVLWLSLIVLVIGGTAIRLAHGMGTAAPSALPASDRIRHLLDQASQSIDGGDFDAALNQATAADSLAAIESDIRSMAEARVYLGKAYSWLQYPDLMLRNLQDGLRLSVEAKDTLTQAELLRLLGGTVYRQMDLQQALPLARQSLALYASVGSTKGRVAALKTLGQVYWSMNLFDSARAAYREGLALANANRFDAERAELLSNIAFVHLRQQEYGAMRDTLLTELALRRASNQPHMTADALCDLSIAYLHLKDYPRGIAAAREALAIGQQVHIGRRDEIAAETIAAIYAEMHNTDSSSAYYKQALALRTQRSTAQLQRYKDVLSRYEEVERHGKELQSQIRERQQTTWIVAGIALAVITVLGAAVRHRHRTAKKLEQMVIERTAALIETNHALLQESEQRRESGESLARSLKEKEALLKEIHHRVKNNMQIISSLLNLQLGFVSGKQNVELFRESQSRVKAMALVHEQLYQSASLAEIDFGGYIKSLAGRIEPLYGSPNVRMELHLMSQPISVETAVPCGLIVNELLTNAFKHAFPNGQKGTIAVTLSRAEDGFLRFEVVDTGVGLPPTEWDPGRKSLGMELVRILVEQIGGRLDISSQHGSTFAVTFPSRLT